MSVRPVALYDANVLYPAQLRDLLIHLAVADLARPHWTDEIHEEWIRNVLADYPDLSRKQLERTRRLMEKALPAARVTGYRRHVERLSLPDPDDRHVLAAAIEAGAGFVVTFNLRDFPQSALAPRGIRALHPDAFVVSLCEEDPDGVLRAMQRHRASLRRPPKSSGEYLTSLRRAGLDHTAAWLAGYAEEL